MAFEVGTTGATNTGPLRIAVLGSRGFPSTYGGFETFVRHLAPDLVARGHSVTVYCRTRRDDQRTRTWEVDKVRCIWTPGTESKAGSTLSFGLTSHLDASWRGFDAALILNVANGFFLPLLRQRGIPTVMNTDGLEWTRGKWGIAAKRIFYMGAQLSTRYADVLVSDSERIVDEWEQEFGARPRFIPYGADVTQHTGDSHVRKLGLEPGTYALSVARLAPENNVDLTLDALDLIPQVPAVIVGSANYASPTESRLRILDERGRLRWLGHVHDQELLLQLWENAGVYIHGHSVGGTNPALLQALAAGAPTIALDTPFNDEVLQDHSSLYPPDAAALAAKIMNVLGDPSKGRASAARGREIVQTRYRWSDVCTEYENALRDAAHLRRTSQEPSPHTA